MKKKKIYKYELKKVNKLDIFFFVSLNNLVFKLEEAMMKYNLYIFSFLLLTQCYCNEEADNFLFVEFFFSNYTSCGII